MSNEEPKSYFANIHQIEQIVRLLMRGSISAVDAEQIIEKYTPEPPPLPENVKHARTEEYWSRMPNGKEFFKILYPLFNWHFVPRHAPEDAWNILHKAIFWEKFADVQWFRYADVETAKAFLKVPLEISLERITPPEGVESKRWCEALDIAFLFSQDFRPPSVLRAVLRTIIRCMLQPRLLVPAYVATQPMKRFVPLLGCLTIHGVMPIGFGENGRLLVIAQKDSAD